MSSLYNRPGLAKSDKIKLDSTFTTVQSNSALWDIPVSLCNDVVVTVDVSGADFTTINEAISSGCRQYKPGLGQYIIQLQSGYIMAEQVLVESLDLSWVSISAVDATTIIDRSALVQEFGAGYPAFCAKTCATLPIISTLFEMSSSGTGDNRHGIVVIDNSKAHIESGCGVNNAGGSGLFAIECSIINAGGASFNGAIQYGVCALNSSTINCASVDASNSATYGIFANIVSTINCANANADNAGDIGIFCARASIINAESATASSRTEPSTGAVYVARGSTVNFRDGIIGSGLGKKVVVNSGSYLITTGISGSPTYSPATKNTLSQAGVIFE
jgi:hypothetical protein